MLRVNHLSGFSVGAVGTPEAPSDPTDPSFANVSFLCGFNGSDGATTATDDSGNAHTITFNGNAQIDTAQSKFGGASLLVDGTGDYCSVPNHAGFRFGSGLFTIESFLRFNSVAAGSQIPLAKWVTTGNQREWALQFSNPGSISGTVLFQYSTTGSNFPDESYALGTALSTGVWYHFAVDFDGTNLRIYQDGVMKKKAAFASTIFASTASLAIGARSVPDFYFNGWMDEVRITKGVARYASDGGFTVPTAAFPRA